MDLKKGEIVCIKEQTWEGVGVSHWKVLTSFSLEQQRESYDRWYFDEFLTAGFNIKDWKSFTDWLEIQNVIKRVDTVKILTI